MDLRTPNIPLLRKAVEWAETEATKTDGTCEWNQQWYAEVRPCGTAYCIAGFAILSTVNGAQVVESENLEIDGEYASWFETGAAVLGLSEGQAYDLFAGGNSIADVRRIAEAIAARAGERL